MAKKRLGELLVEAGIITPKQLAEALEDQKRYGGKLGSILLDRRFITEEEFIRVLTSQLKIPAIDFTKSNIPESVIKLVPQELAEKYSVFPVGVKHTPQGRILILAMSDPTNVEAQDQIRFTTGMQVEPVLALDRTLQYVIRDYYYHAQGQGSYRLEVDINAAPSEAEPELTIEGLREIEPSGPEMLTRPADEEFKEKKEEKPRLSRELRTLLKILARKGIITPQEYLEEFKKTE